MTSQKVLITINAYDAGVRVTGVNASPMSHGTGIFVNNP